MFLFGDSYNMHGIVFLGERTYANNISLKQILGLPLVLRSVFISSPCSFKIDPEKIFLACS